MTAHELVAKIARMTPSNNDEDNEDTLARLIWEAQQISALPQPDSAGLIAEARALASLWEGDPQMIVGHSKLVALATALEAAEARAVEAERERDNLRRNYQDQIAKSVVAVCRAVDERKAAERQLAAAREAIEDALDDMGDDFCVCPAAKDQLREVFATLSDAPASDAVSKPMEG